MTPPLRTASHAAILALSLTASLLGRQDDGADAAHAALWAESRFPAATACRTCHPEQYREWSVSPHAYTQVSPVFNAMQGALLQGTNGTLGDFCIRCHTPTGMALEEPVFGRNAERAAVSLEGVTCVTCHRVNQAFGKVNARYPIVEGGLTAPVWGPHGGEEQRRAMADPETYGVLTTDPDRTGREIHAEARFFEPISSSAFCATCHEITLTGFREDESYSEWRMSAASTRGESCQDCHMGRVQGVAAGYDEGPAAIVGGEPTRPTRRTNHMFPGPDQPMVPPGIFPHDPRAAEMATPEEWALFDHAAGWGTDAFEDEVALDAPFPERWEWADDRYLARELVDDGLALREELRRQTLELLRNGFGLGRPSVEPRQGGGVELRATVMNLTNGHNAPTGFLGERQVFLRTTVRDARGDVVFASGDADLNGDVRDQHSLYVRAGEVELDRQLFALTSNFVTRNLFGGEREQPLTVNYSSSTLPWVRPDTRPTVLTGRKQSIRIHKRSIEPGGSRTARYDVGPDALSGPGPFRATVELVVRSFPPHLLAEIAHVGFEYGLSARDLGEACVAQELVVHEVETTFDAPGSER